MVIDLTNRDNDSFDDEGKNIVQLTIITPKGERIVDPNYRVEMTFSKDAMIGFATEMLRASQKEIPNVCELYSPIGGLVSQCMGVFVHPDSCGLILDSQDFGVINDLVARS